jgi:YVTN family beta-propeller protein
MKTISSILLAICAAALVAGTNPAIESRATSTTASAEPMLNRIVLKPGKTLADFMPAALDYTQTDVDPGIAPEGDFMGFSAFTRDGNRVLLTNRMTDNVTVYDWATQSVITNIPVGDYPGGIACTDSFAVITLGFVDSVLVMRLSDYSIAARLPSGTQPWVVRISPDQQEAYVACDISNTCEVYDLQNLTHAGTIPNFPIFLSTYSWNSENARNAFTFSDFKPTPDGTHLILPYADSIFFYDVATGACDDTILSPELCRFVEFSGDSTKFVTCLETNPATAWQIDVATHEVTDTVVITGHTLMTYETAVNMDGSKAYFGVSNNQSVLVKFETGDFVTYSSTYTAFWVGVSPDHTRAVSAQSNFSIIDFDTEAMLGQHSGNPQSVGAVSPVGNRAIGYDPHRNEGAYFYDYTTPGPGMFLANTPAGLDPEGDAPHRIAVTPNGAKAVCSNVLSDNVSIVNMATGTVDTIIPVGDRPQEVAITRDSRWAVVTGGNSPVVAILDLSNNTTAATLNVGGGPFTVSLSPDDSFAWVGNISANTVSKVQLDGAASQVIDNIPVGEIGMIWGAYGMPSATRASPDGRYVLVAVSFTDEVQVIDAQTSSIVATVSTGDFPLDFAFNSTGQYATVSNALGNSISVIHVQGESSATVGTYGHGQYPCRLAYDPVVNRIGVVNMSSRNVVYLDPETGDLLNTVSYSSYGNPVQIQFDENGKSLVGIFGTNDPGFIIRDTQVIATTAVPCYFDYSAAGHRAAVASPGPDWVTILDWTSSGVARKAVSPGQPGFRVIAPSVVRSGPVRVSYDLPVAGIAGVAVYDLRGARVATLFAGQASAGRHEANWETGRATDGVYFIRLEQNGRTTARRILLAE